MIRNNHEAQKMASDRKEFAAIVDKAIGFFVRLRGVLETFAYLKKSGLMSSMDRRHINELLATVENIEGQVKEGYLQGSEVNELKLRLQLVEGMGGNLWHVAALEIKQLISSLKIMLELSPEQSGLGRIIRELESHIQSPPKNEKAARSLVARLEEAKEVVGNRGFDEEIERFLQRIMTGRATLADLSHKVDHWVAENGFRSRIKLSL